MPPDFAVAPTPSPTGVDTDGSTQGGDAQPTRLLVVIGSTRPGRFGPTVVEWFATHARRYQNFSVQVTDLAELTIPSGEFGAAVAGSDAVVIVTPEYNHSFPGPLKEAVDSLGSEWHAKPVGFVSYGGISGGLRAVEALRVVFAELHAVTMRETVGIPHVWDRFDANGTPHDPQSLSAAADRLLDQLSWWSATIRAGREIRAYTG